MTKNSLYLLLAALFISLPVRAQVGDSENEISVFASGCETLINNESKASARVRATDKASFKAVEEIPELSRFRSRMKTHDFNIKIYQLVDNYLEDLKITATSPNDDQVCIELSAYLPASAVREVFAEENNAPAAEDMTLEVENIDDNVNITVPPKPDITINRQIAYEKAAAAPVEAVEQEPLPVAEKAATISEPVQNNKTKVFIEQTKFYNGTSTGGFFAELEKNLRTKPGVEAVTRQDNADYVLETEILKARVDNINSETRRLQIVVSLKLTDVAAEKTTTEHQNRFILFNASDDAQTVAADLTRKLLSAGVSKLLPDIKTFEQTSVITPDRPHFQARPDAA